MRRAEAAYLAVCTGVIAFNALYCLPVFHSIDLVWYYPLEHRWAYETRPTGLAVSWYGRNLLAAAASVLSSVAALLVTRRLPSISPRAMRGWGIVAMLSTVMAMSVYTYDLADRHPTPEPLPSWYVPR